MAVWPGVVEAGDSRVISEPPRRYGEYVKAVVHEEGVVFELAEDFLL